MIPALAGIDWRSFLDRPLLPAPSQNALDQLREQSILVTGAGGSIGAALALRLAPLAPRKLLLLEAAESRLVALGASLASIGFGQAAQIQTELILGDLANRNLLEDLFDQHRPTLVFHAAAHKHVPLLEGQPFAAIENNIFGTQTIASAARAQRARVLLLSTDKAVEPASILGASKRVAEMIALNSDGAVLRLGNVLGSSGSVAEVFAEQIAGGGPITVTAPRARRYFLTIEEAVNLLIASSVDKSTPSLYVPALNDQHSIADLARFLARTLSAQRDVAVSFTAPRPGDKETEKLRRRDEGIDDERKDLERNSGLLRLCCSPNSDGRLHQSLKSLRDALGARDLTLAIDVLRSLIPDFSPSQTLLSLARQSASRAAR